MKEMVKKYMYLSVLFKVCI